VDTPNELRPGQIEIELKGWGRPLTLIPSIDAAISLNRRYKGLRELAERVQAYDFDAFVAVIAAGAQVTDKGLAKLPGCVFETGLLDLVVPLTKFCTVLANGGRPLVSRPDVDEDAEPPDPSP
jgi:hypothetical protein